MGAARGLEPPRPYGQRHLQRLSEANEGKKLAEGARRAPRHVDAAYAREGEVGRLEWSRAGENSVRGSSGGAGCTWAGANQNGRAL